MKHCLTTGILLMLVAPLEPLFAQAAPSFAIRSVRVFDGKRVAENRTVLVRDGVILRVGGTDLTVPARMIVIDGRGRTLLPGLMDAHVHLTGDLELNLKQAASLGVTTVFDMWSGDERLGRIKTLEASDPPGMADVRTAGNGATAPGGHPSQMGGPPPRALTDTTDTRAFVAARFAEGADYLKIIYDDLERFGRPLPMLSRATLAALIAAAHEQRKLAVVHIGSEIQAREAVEAKADGLVHLFAAGAVSAALAPLIAKYRAFVVPTLGALYNFDCGKSVGAAIVADSLLYPYVRTALRPGLTRQFGSPDKARSCAGTEDLIRQLSSHGVSILVGTDAPSPGQTYGASVHGEMALLVGAGLTPIQVLTAATSAPAARFRLADRGAIRPGLRADLVLVEGDPMRDILATRRIVTVWKRGIPVERVRYPDQSRCHSEQSEESLRSSRDSSLRSE